MSGRRLSLDEQLSTKVQRDPSGCWLWTGYVTDKGYGQIRVRNVGVRLAHRVVYEHLVGPVPAGLVLDHLCRVRHCVNPAHLEPVTNRRNVLRGAGVTATRAAQTHCKRGHPLTGANLQPRADGYRRCRTCNRLRTPAQRQGAAA